MCFNLCLKKYAYINISRKLVFDINGPFKAEAVDVRKNGSVIVKDILMDLENSEAVSNELFEQYVYLDISGNLGTFKVLLAQYYIAL